MVVPFARPAHDRVAAAAVGGRVVAVALAGDPEAVGVVHVQQGVVLAGQGGEGRQVGRVAGHRVDPVHADQARAPARAPEQPPGVLDVAGAEPPHGRPPGGGHAGGVVDGPVGAQVDQDRPLAGERREHAVVGMGQGGEGEDVLDPEQLADRRLDPPVGHRAGDRPGPAGMGPPAGQVGRHLGDHLEVEVKPEVVAGGEVDQPVAVDLDPPAVDLLDNGVAHRVLDHEPGHLGNQLGYGVSGGSRQISSSP